MSHYYLNDESVKDDIKEINVIVKGSKYKFKTNSGVFSKHGLDFGSRLLIEEAYIPETAKSIADIGSGYGPIGIILASLNVNVVANLYEINSKAVELSKENAQLNNVNNIKINLNNILENVEETFDVILTNPPIRAGKEVVFSIYEQAYSHLNNNGLLYVVIQKKQGAESSFKKINDLFKNATVLTKSKGYWIIKAEKIDID